ncbi:MCP four helix bundle domain-containing protein [Geomonas sp. Red69]|uniref:HAMP domain-containing methyl-accepting chemotaxis protein n=1 Tax=Geomonas diazotrophica TaxID=2843197 RepID=UPI001C110D77|nr:MULTISPECIES: methyl-accepting chemotaxis protein [Geomonas]MBU5637620.1 MCP four helix bundle domain-containing protein [Geomonas diazotrophica]QXE88430.1 MCP four helix bundle domain-containing protein [Geomonas nitrogeniifigens]
MLSNLKIRSRLVAGFSVLVLFLILIGALSLKNLAAEGDLLSEFYEHPFAVTNAIQQVDTNITRMHRGMKDVILYASDREDMEASIAEIESCEKNVYRQLALARERVPGDKSKIDQIRESMDQWKVVRGKTIVLAQQGKVKEAIAFHKAYARRTVAQIDAQVNEVLKDSYSIAERFAAESSKNQRFTFAITAVLVALACILAAVIAFAITASITRPLTDAVQAADRLAQGDVSVEIGSSSPDELGQLLRAMGKVVQSMRGMGETANRIALGDLDVEVVPLSEADVFGKAMRDMVASLNTLADNADRIASGDLTIEVLAASPKDRLGNSFQAMTRNLRELTFEIAEVVNVLAGSAAEIMTTVSELASSSAQTATSISETNATVQEIRQTTDLTSQKSRQVYESAHRSTQIARTGRESVNSAIGGMQGIDERMGFIAERIVNLSEQSQAIGEIIATVADLAEQSNLLAVNAAIEAAKAGEHGKGFAVVAQEVKNLATQSKQATSQVRSIIGQIQKATTAAVLATEQGSKAVEAGVKQSSEAGESIRQLAASIEESSNATLQIVTSTQEQAIGMDQIAIAIQSINQASDQNVEGSRQIEAAARNLYELNQKLQRLVSGYKVA